MIQQIHARRVLTEYGWRENQAVAVSDGIITAITPLAAKETQFDAEQLCPAYIDTHVHGGQGMDVMDDNPQALKTIAAFKAQQGVAAWLATTVTAPLPDLRSTLRRIARYCQQQTTTEPVAEVLGSYLEGPYFTPQNKGAHSPELFRELQISELDTLIADAEGTLKVVALAPEKPEALNAIRHLKRRGLNVMLGHSAATYEQTLAALDAGADGLVHCFNGMTGLHHREPGMAGAGLSDPRAWLELIADGHHVHPAVMGIVCQCAAHRTVLITDAMRAAGQPDGIYDICGHDVTMKAGIVRTASGGLAGSTLALDDAVSRMISDTGTLPETAIRMASLQPAQLLGITTTHGSISAGKRAHFNDLNSDWRVTQTWIHGQPVR
ncbi:TPA: N-acetylglucosamine-6-phosphate deacetylase [Morganella morganii]|uniref:N-acetylglucosamine-6-phosphate deacetylase n=1 Tax=Morganella morganii TaxID=582 RepID=UPI001BDA7724|nr:N-acetylglucosamine-6-phosphate deacetylase [Morganella morganii]MBT0380094.1 N-acetylglucosamine-6-phosphate deacetylase [Morganella morganii subsp. morganii]HDU8608660.1 N-acetylglucosamine-6-phosphate deacetylase [Morganella morganii]